MVVYHNPEHVSEPQTDLGCRPILKGGSTTDADDSSEKGGQLGFFVLLHPFSFDPLPAVLLSRLDAVQSFRLTFGSTLQV